GDGLRRRLRAARKINARAGHGPDRSERDGDFQAETHAVVFADDTREMRRRKIASTSFISSSFMMNAVTKKAAPATAIVPASAATRSGKFIRVQPANTLAWAAH